MHAAVLALLAALPALGGAVGPEGAGAPAADGRTLREADQALARAVQQGDLAAFGALLTEDACFLGSRGGLLDRAAVQNALAGLLEAGAPRLGWSPDLAELSRSGDLGYTLGGYELERRDGSGHSVKREGRYVTVWRREADGRFRAVASAPLLPPAAERVSPEPTRVRERALTSRDGDLVVEIGSWRAAGPSPQRGVYLAILRRTREGTLAAALESLVPAGAP